MTEMRICDSCEERFDDEWNGYPMKIIDTTGVHLHKRELHLCVECAADARDRLEEMIVDV